MKKGEKKPGWYRIDNAGVLYSSLQTDTYSAVYRFSAVMTQTVDTEALQRAVDKTMPRFPTFNVRIRKGAFWYYFEPDGRPGPFVQPDVANPCAPVNFRDPNARLVRFFYYQKRISIECFHAVTDGAGAVVFFRTLLAIYLGELGFPIPPEHGILDITQPPPRQEQEDAYRRYAVRRGVSTPNIKKAYSTKGTAEEFYTLNLTMGFFSLKAVRALAHSHGVSVTEYLSAVLIYVLLQRQKAENPARPKQVSLAIPINLRGHFETQTLRNFIITIRPYIDPNLGEYTFPQVISQVHHYMRLHISPQLMRGRFSSNVNFQRHFLLKKIPIFFKDPIMALSYKLAGVRPFSATYTNPGPFPVHPLMEPHIQHVEATLGQPYGNRINCTSISFGDKMEVTFSSNIRERDIEREFFRFLVKEGLPISVESNRPN